MIKKVLFIIVLLFCTTSVVCAETKKSPYSLGLGVITSTRPYQGIGTKTLVVPMVSWQSKNFYFRGIEIGYRLIKKQHVDFFVFLSPRLMGYEKNPSSQMVGMHQRRMSADMGLKGVWHTPFSGVDVTAQITQDMLNVYQGQEMSLAISYFLRHKKFRLIPQIGVKWQSSSMTQYYYGVSWNEVNIQRNAYQPQYAMNYFADIKYHIDVFKDWTITASLALERLDDEIVDSPIVERRTVVSSMLGLMKKF